MARLTVVLIVVESDPNKEESKQNPDEDVPKKRRRKEANRKPKGPVDKQKLFGKVFKSIGRGKLIQCVRTDGSSFHLTLVNDLPKAPVASTSPETGPKIEDLLEEDRGNAVYIDPGVRDVSIDIIANIMFSHPYSQVSCRPNRL